MDSVTVFTRNDCPYCQLLKRFLDMKKAKYKVVNIDEDANAMAEVQALTGRTIAPTTMVVKSDGTKDVVVGYNLSRVVSALGL